MNRPSLSSVCAVLACREVTQVDWVLKGEGPDNVLKPAVVASGLVYLKEEGEGGVHFLSSPNCPRACPDSQTEDRRGKHTSKCVLDDCGVLSASQSQDCSVDGAIQCSPAGANHDATVGMQCCRWPVDGSESLESDVWWDTSDRTESVLLLKNYDKMRDASTTKIISTVGWSINFDLNWPGNSPLTSWCALSV